MHGQAGGQAGDAAPRRAPVAMAVVVAMAGMMRPAISLACEGGAGGADSRLLITTTSVLPGPAP